MKTCPKCKKNLPQKQYYKRRDCITSTYCVDCTSKKNVDKWTEIKTGDRRPFDTRDIDYRGFAFHI